MTGAGNMERVMPTEDPYTVKASLKWFNVQQGYGFVVPENEAVDAFLHITTLQKAGIKKLGPCACLLCRLERNPNGVKVREVVSILDEGIQPEPVGSERYSVNQNNTFELTGTVKWYDPERGFGFVTADDGQKDVFLHQKCLHRYGLNEIKAQTPVKMTVALTAKGREAVSFRLLEERSGENPA